MSQLKSKYNRFGNLIALFLNILNVEVFGISTVIYCIKLVIPPSLRPSII